MATIRRRSRLILLTAAATLLALVLAAGIAIYFLSQPQRITHMLQAEASKAGMTLVMGAPPDSTLWPQPAVVLHSLTLSADNRPVLVAARTRVVLPWRALLGGPINVTRLELDAPRLHLSQLEQTLDLQQPRQGKKVELPRVNIGIYVNNGSLVNNGRLVLDNLNLTTGPLMPGRIFQLRITANTHEGPFELTALATPREQPGTIQFEHVHIRAGVGKDGIVNMSGKILWKGGMNVHLALKGTARLPSGRTYQTGLDMAPAAGGDTPLVHLKLSGPGADVDLAMPPARLATWWGTISNPGTRTALPLPPLDGVVTATKLDFGDLHIEGLQLRSGSAVPAAPSSTGATGTAPTTP